MAATEQVHNLTGCNLVISSLYQRRSRTAEHPVSELEHGLVVYCWWGCSTEQQATCYEELAETTGNMLCGTEKTGYVLHAERTETTDNMHVLKQRATCYAELKTTGNNRQSWKEQARYDKIVKLTYIWQT